MRENFSQSQQATLYDSDPKPLKFRFRNRTTGVESSIINAPVLGAANAVDDFNPRLYDTNMPGLALLSEPYECRQRNAVNFQLRFKTPAPTVTPQQPIVTQYPTRTPEDIAFQVKQTDDGLLTHSHETIKMVYQLPVDNRRFLKTVDVHIDTGWSLPDGDTDLMAAVYMNPGDTIEGADKAIAQKQAILVHGATKGPFGASSRFVDQPRTAAGNMSIPCQGQSLEFYLQSTGYLLDSAPAPQNGQITITLHYEIRSVNNQISVKYSDYLAYATDTAIKDYDSPIDISDPSLKLKRVQIHIPNPIQSNVLGGTTILAMASINSGATVFTTGTVGTSNSNADSTCDSGPLDQGTGGQHIGIGLHVVDGLLSDLSQGHLYVELDWETTSYPPPIVTPFAWTRPNITGFNVSIFGSFDNEQYSQVPGTIISGKSGPRGSEVMQLPLYPANDMYFNPADGQHQNPPYLDDLIFNHAVIFYPSTPFVTSFIQSAPSSTTNPPYNFYRVLIEFQDIEGTGLSNDGPVTFNLRAIAREV